MEKKNNSKLAFSEENELRLKKMAPHYPNSEALLIPALHMALEQFGQLTPDVLEFVAERLELPPSKAMAVSSFYTMLHRDKKGTYNIQVCRTLSCALLGAEEIIAHLEKKLGIKVGETTQDGKFTLSTAECLASCGTAPMMQINVDEYHESLTLEKVDEILDQLR